MARAERRAANPSYNFVENLLVHGLMPTRGVPSESGVRFFVDAAIRDEGLCLVFCVDWGGAAPLIGDDQVKPDYLVLFVPFDGSSWIFTIVEMKGTDSKNLRHGLKQIRYFHEVHRHRIEEHLPRWVRTKWQGILLHASGAQIPLGELNNQGSACPVRPIASHHQVDLYPYIRQPLPKKISATVPAHRGRNTGSPGCFNGLERAICCASRHSPGESGRAGFSLHARSYDKNEHSLTCSREAGTISLKSTRTDPDLHATLARFPKDCLDRCLVDPPFPQSV